MSKKNILLLIVIIIIILIIAWFIFVRFQIDSKNPSMNIVETSNTQEFDTTIRIETPEQKKELLEDLLPEKLIQTEDEFEARQKQLDSLKTNTEPAAEDEALIKEREEALEKLKGLN